MKRQVQPYTGPMVRGIDVSRYQGVINWDVVPQGIHYAFIRTGDGRSTDTKFAQNWVGARNVGIRTGSYHYFRADRGGRMQAEHVISLLDKVGFTPGVDLPPVIDIEEGTRTNLDGGVFPTPTNVTDNIPLDVVAAECLEYLETLEEHLRVRPMVYTGQAFHWWYSQTHPEIAEKFAKYPLWVPSYTAEPMLPASTTGEYFPWKTWTFWQYKSTGEVPGIVGNVDMNQFRGTLADLTRFVEDSVIQKEPPVEVAPDLVQALLAEHALLAEQLHDVAQEIAALVEGEPEECPD